MFDELRQKVFEFESKHGVVEIDSLRESNQASSFGCAITCPIEGCGGGCNALCLIQNF